MNRTRCRTDGMSKVRARTFGFANELKSRWNVGMCLLYSHFLIFICTDRFGSGEGDVGTSWKLDLTPLRLLD